jgi:hypothetical protein
MKHPALCRARRGLAVLTASGLLWDTATGTWAVEPGEHQLAVGRSGRDLPLTVTVSERGMHDD